MFWTIALRLPFEMLYRICHIDRGQGNAGFLERLFQYASCRADKRPSHLIFLVPGLFSH